jgi:quinol-cytochrome oxidoreductase complex cytochrome b subunit
MVEGGDSAGSDGTARSVGTAAGTAERTTRPGRIWGWIESRTGISALRYAVPEHANSIWYTLGGITFMAILIAVASGVWIAQYYNPDPAAARESVIFIQNEAPLGDIIRGIHIWSAYIAIIMSVAHMVRIFISGSYKGPREINWLVGVGLLGLIMFGAFFTGTVLRWDQESYEALAHNTEIASLFGAFGGFFSDAFTTSVAILPRLYIAHVSIVPMLLIFFLIAHIFLIKYHGISPTPAQEEAGEAPGGQLPKERQTANYMTHARKMLGYGIVVLGLAGTLAVLWPGAIGTAPDPSVEITKPSPIYYWFYALEGWLGVNGILYGVIAFFGILALVPFIDRTPLRSLRKRPVMLVLGLLLVVAVVVLSLITYFGPVVSHMG